MVTVARELNADEVDDIDADRMAAPIMPNRPGMAKLSAKTKIIELACSNGLPS